MIADGYYGKVTLPSGVFKKLDKHYFISSCTNTTKFMCANPDETRHLISLGVKPVTCDWYKIVLEEIEICE
jgi:hypothetical protein